jgi:hypothetical protein
MYSRFKGESRRQGKEMRKKGRNPELVAIIEYKYTM